MRLWHKDLIPVLPRQQLLGQWRECCLIAKNLAEKGTPGHLLVNRILEYPIEHYWTYMDMVCVEMERRGYRCDFHRIERFQPESVDRVFPGRVFSRWHNLRYLQQCYANLEEKYDCGGVTDEEWQRFRRGFCAIIEAAPGRMSYTLNDIARFPKADVQEVKHGQWIHSDLILNRSICSVCKFRTDEIDYAIMKYCPNCGAQMDL